ncbi:MAG: tetratricopeptide repeat protein [Planctomycetota bacterium]
MPSIDQIRSMLESDPDDAFLRYALAQELAKAGEHDEAIAEYDRVIAIDAHEHYAYFHKARSLEACGEIEQAIATLEAGLNIATADAEQKAASEIAGYINQLR